MLLKEWRWEKLMQQGELADKLEYSQPELSKVESGSYRPSIKFIQRFVQVFGKKEAALIDEFKYKEE